MERILEPELMEGDQQVLAYAQADFTQPHDDFIHRLRNVVNDPEFSGHALDLGCGPCDISRRFLDQYPLATLDAVDGSTAMLDCGKKMTPANVLARIKFVYGKLPDAELPKARYDLIFSNSLLHHLPDPQTLWDTVKKYSHSGTLIGVMDLIRPRSTLHAKSLVDKYAANEPPILQHDFYHSLLAAFTVEDIKHQLFQAQLPFTVEPVSDRHIFISGIMA